MKRRIIQQRRNILKNSRKTSIKKKERKLAHHSDALSTGLKKKRKADKNRFADV